jgi:hypothetical protein
MSLAQQAALDDLAQHLYDFLLGKPQPYAPSADVGAGTVTAYFVDNGRLGVLVRLEVHPDKDGPDFHFLGHELCL